MRRDSWNNAINSYVMLHFIYRLNIFGGKSGSGSDNRERGGRGGMRMGGMGGPGGGPGGFGGRR